MIKRYERLPKPVRFVMRMTGNLLSLIAMPIWGPLLLIGGVIALVIEWIVDEWRMS